MLKQSDVSNLFDAAPTLGVSIFLPTHSRGPKIRQNPIRLRALLAEASGKLNEAGIAPEQADALLAPAAALVEDYGFWQHQDRGLALFLGARETFHHHLPVPTPESVVVGTGFHIRPLLDALAGEDAFLLLAIAVDRVRLFEAGRSSMREAPQALLPEAVGTAEGYGAPQQASPADRPQVANAGVTKAQVQGKSPEEWRKRRMVTVLHRIAAAMDARMAGDRRPVVVAAGAQALGHFRRASKLGPRLIGVVEVDPEALDQDALHGAALGVAQPHFEARRLHEAEQPQARRDGDDSSTAMELPALLEAARASRIQALLLAEAVTTSEDENLRDGDGAGGSPDASAAEP